MITAFQLRAARALLGIDQLTLALRSKLSLPTIQRMETSGGLIRGNVDSLVKVVQALGTWASNSSVRGVRVRSVVVAGACASGKSARPIKTSA